MARVRDNAALEREIAQRRLDARELMRLPAFRRLARWLIKPTEKLPYSATDRDTAFRAGQWLSANELRELLRAANFDAFQRLEREGRTELVHRRRHASPS